MPYKDKNKQREFQRIRVKIRRENWLILNGPCCKCGSADRLEIDHINPELKISHRIWSWAEERRTKELAKCQVLCYNCHKEKTKKENQRPITHGTNGGYHRGCRCDKCRQYQIDRMNKYHLEHPRKRQFSSTAE